MTALLVGLGSPDRGDDAVGPQVARAVADLALPAVRVVEQEDPTALVLLWSDYDQVVVVDAVVSGAACGALHHLETGQDGPPLGSSGPSGSPAGGGLGTHAFGLNAAVELARALGRLPRRLSVVGVEASAFDHGAPLSEPVAAAVPEAVRRVTGLLVDPQVPTQGPAPARS